MTNKFYLSTTYLKLIRNQPQLMALLLSRFGEEFEALTQTDYLFDADINKVFNVALEAGVDSWLLNFGSKISVASHGPLGFAVLSAPDLYSAISTLIDFTEVRTSVYKGEYRTVGNRIELLFHEQTNEVLIGRWLIESAIYVAQSLIETMMSHPLGENAEIHFAYPKPDYAERLEDFYNVNCIYNAEHNMLSIPASWSRVSSPLSDPQTYSSNLQKCQELKRQLTQNDDAVITAQLEFKRFFDARVSGQSLEDDIPSLDILAERHHCSTRTYARKLADHQHSYKGLLEAARKQQALQLLDETHLNIADIALILAYQEPANFVRAFKIWFKITPGAWRKRPKI